MVTITVQDGIMAATKNIDKYHIEQVNIERHEVSGLPKNLTMFDAVRVMLRYNVDKPK